MDGIDVAVAIWSGERALDGLMRVSLNRNPGLLSMHRDKPAAARILEGSTMFVRTDNNKKKKTSKKAKNNQHRQGRLILFVRSSYYRCVCIINERSLSNWYCSWFVAVRVPGEIDGQVNDLSSALVSALLRRRLKNYNMRFDRKKRS
ncbi:Uncharacterized protein FWK35_00019412 [Aphis craccivora]|uniref:Uncharacterized protein n=1 Tax=Aphis craccivora TaxID=307492 RepID=A0A6G0YXR0_APHCR|nr:Uncharacterized protein FWK35_00019412 [Aphis craccivora]